MGKPETFCGMYCHSAKQIVYTHSHDSSYLKYIASESLCCLWFNLEYHTFRVLGFLLYLLGALLAFNSLGAGLGKRTQKPLGAHQERILITIKENMAVSIYRPNYELFIISCVGKLHIIRLLHQLHWFNHWRCFTPIICLLITSLYKTRRILAPK
jgi:hypothetical protein